MRPTLKEFCGLLVALWNLGGEPVLGQPDYGARLGLGQGPDLSFEPQGPGVMLGALDPAVRRWYVPQELFAEYQWHQWEYTNYARDPYQRYVNTALEGDYFYDIYGNFLARGWLIFNNSQIRPQQFGNSLFKATRFDRWFSGVVIAADLCLPLARRQNTGAFLAITAEIFGWATSNPLKTKPITSST